MEVRTERERHSVFISYSHHDREWLDRLNVHLRPLVRENALDVWDDTKIAPGSTWRSEIESALASAKVAILLVSADFLASDFVASSEIPSLLAAASDEGVVILPLIVSPSRFTRTPSLAQFQSVNDPARPLIGLSRSDQEEILVRLTDAVNRAMGRHQAAINAKAERSLSNAPLIDSLHLGECLARLGCNKEWALKEERFIMELIDRRVAEDLWRSEGPSVENYLKELGEPEPVAANVERFAGHILACYAPAHRQVNSMYTSTKKVSDAYRLLQSQIEAEWLPSAEVTVDDKLLRVHSYLVKTGRLLFLPAKLLLDGDLPTRGDEVCYFEGSFTLDVDDSEIAKVPGALQAMAGKVKTSMYGVVSNVFGNPDPFVYPLLRFAGSLGKFSATMILSRKYIQFSSMTASFLAQALNRRPLKVSGIGTIRQSDGIHEVHPLACSGSDESI